MQTLICHYFGGVNVASKRRATLSLYATLNESVKHIKLLRRP